MESETKDKIQLSPRTKNLQIDIETFKEHKFFAEIIYKSISLPETVQYQILFIIKILNSKTIDKDKLCMIIYEGLDESPSLRSLIWKILLNYLPLNIYEWEETLNKNRNQYKALKEKLLPKELRNQYKRKQSSQEKKNRLTNNDQKAYSKMYKKYNSSSENIIKSLQTKDQIDKRVDRKTTSDHPLAFETNSKWKQHFEDMDLYEEIDKDVQRTRVHMDFFSQEVNSGGIGLLSKTSVGKTGAEILTNILFIYSKEHPDIKYSQGMNELVAPLLYCFSMDSNPFFNKYIEEDTYFCFLQLMSGLELWYVDNYANVPFKINEFEQLFKIKDNALYHKFRSIGIDFNFFLLRWISLCFSQEFEIPEVLRIWDSAFSSGRKLTEFLSLLAISILKLNRDSLIFGSFSDVMEFVQDKIKEIDLEKVLRMVPEMNNEL